MPRIIRLSMAFIWHLTTFCPVTFKLVYALHFFVFRSTLQANGHKCLQTLSVFVFSHHPHGVVHFIILLFMQSKSYVIYTYYWHQKIAYLFYAKKYCELFFLWISIMMSCLHDLVVLTVTQFVCFCIYFCIKKVLYILKKREQGQSV